VMERSAEKIKRAAAGQGDELKEHVPESVKNMLLVMCSDGLLDKERNKVRWEATFSVLHEFLPEMEEFITAATNPQCEPIPVVSDAFLARQDGEAGATEPGAGKGASASTAESECGEGSEKIATRQPSLTVTTGALGESEEAPAAADVDMDRNEIIGPSVPVS
jgi:hypothetical protein